MDRPTLTPELEAVVEAAMRRAERRDKRERWRWMQDPYGRHGDMYIDVSDFWGQ